jgi:hypothetical protein
VNDYRGYKLVWHTGGLSGMVSRVTMVPDLKLGVIVLTNQEAGGAFSSITMTILDQYMKAAPTDWVAGYDAAVKLRESTVGDPIKKTGAKRNAASTPSLALSTYAGRYRDPWYGDVTISEEAGKLILRFTHTPI